MNPPAKLSDLLLALESPLDPDEHYARFDRQTGAIVSVERRLVDAAEAGEPLTPQELPAWQREEIEIAQAIANDESDRFIAPPSPFDFHEYSEMERFIGTVTDAAHAEQLWRALKGRGAFGRFKHAAERLGLLEAWFEYRETAMKEFVIAWAEAHEVAYIDDSVPSRGGGTVRNDT